MSHNNSRRFIKYQKLTGVTPGLLFEKAMNLCPAEVALDAKSPTINVREDIRGHLSIETASHVYREDGFHDEDVQG